MAIEIEQGVKIKSIFWPIVLLVFSLMAATGFLISYLYVSQSYSDLESQAAEVRQGLVKSAEEKALEDELTGYQEKISIFEKIFSEHKKTHNAITLMESICHPDVYFSGFSFDAKTGQASLDAKALDFFTVSQQILILKDKKDIFSNIVLSQISQEEEKSKGIGFSISFIIDPQILKQ